MWNIVRYSKILFQWCVGHYQSTQANSRMHGPATINVVTDRRFLRGWWTCPTGSYNLHSMRSNSIFHLRIHHFISAKVIKSQLHIYKIKIRQSEVTFPSLPCKLKYFLPCFTFSNPASTPVFGACQRENTLE